MRLREPKDNEILLRVDALGLCLSDIKIIKQGGDHPRLRGRDLADIYYEGVNFAFGYMIPGGLAQYSYLDERALDGDEGC